MSATTNDEQRLDEFRAAIHRGDVPAVHRMLEGDEFYRQQVNAPIFAFGGRPIAQAKTNRAMVDLLLEFGADLNLKSDWWAGGWGIVDDVDADTADFQISRGAAMDIFAAAHLDRLDRLRELLNADPSLVHARGGDGCRPLHYARSAPAIDLLLERGAEIDARDVDHEATAAQWALPHPSAAKKAGDSLFDRTRHLVERGAQVDLFMAVALNNQSLLEQLIQSDPTLLDQRIGGAGYPPCPVAPGKHIYVYTFGERRTPHDIAAAYGHEEVFNLLMSPSAPRQRLAAAVISGNQSLAQLAMDEDPEALAALIEREPGLLPTAAWQG